MTRYIIGLEVGRTFSESVPALTVRLRDPYYSEHTNRQYASAGHAFFSLSELLYKSLSATSGYVPTLRIQPSPAVPFSIYTYCLFINTPVQYVWLYIAFDIAL